MTNEVAKYEWNANEAAKHKSNGKWGCYTQEQLQMRLLSIRTMKNEIANHMNNANEAAKHNYNGNEVLKQTNNQ